MSVPNNSDVIHIALAFCDPKGTYCRHVSVVMASIFANTSSTVCIHIVHDNTLRIDNKAKLQELADSYNQAIDFINIDNIFEGNRADVGRLSAKGAKGMLFRLLIPDIINESKLIYLDCDIVVNLDIAELWRIPLEGHAVAVARDVVSLNCINGGRVGWRTRQLWNLWRIRCGEYFNSGVILMNLEKIRTQYNFFAEVEAFYSKFKKCTTFADQDCLNYIFADDKLLIDERFNRIDTCGADDDNVKGFIWHMAGEKPWVVYTRPHVDDLYWRYLRLTPYCNDENSLISLMLENLSSSVFTHRHSSDCVKRLKKQLADNIFHGHTLTVPHILFRKIVK
ncbi:glycosyltransferase family 8 protein [uncultured Cloacibacillus sp.]|uniref:glycosyltransferase family 8 protein n=1 Tax=uncultured Cloacibacillus sp. TaxID=889794 RepID=UPI0026368BDE|nr:glycosyltransferase family 8 protein [uncultured Cloacibacillus sp.]